MNQRSIKRNAIQYKSSFQKLMQFNEKSNFRSRIYHQLEILQWNLKHYQIQLFITQEIYQSQNLQIIKASIQKKHQLNLLQTLKQKQKKISMSNQQQKPIVENHQHSEQSSSQSETINDRLKKKLKVLQNVKQKVPTQNPINISQNVDITQLALKKYDEIKQNYNFVSFDEAKKTKTVTVGSYEKFDIPTYDFNQQMYKFKKRGFCANPNTQIKGYVFDQNKLKLLNQGNPNAEKDITNDQQVQKQYVQILQSLQDKKNRKQFTKKYKQMRQTSGGIVQNYQSPWAGYGQNLQNGAITPQQQQKLQQAEKRKQQKIQQAKLEQENFEPYNIFHWKQFYDYKGFSYVDPPADFKPNYSTNFIPKKQLQTWVSSQKAGYQCLRFFPKVGHLLLVGNPEGKVHLFDVMKNRTCAHTYIGHTKAIRDIQFTNDGKHFLSCAFDGQVHYWDTEYGKVLRTFKLKRIPFTSKFHPTNQNSFLVGSNNRKILQFDITTGTKQFQYSQHTGTINTIDFIEENKFVSTADDKKLFIWEYGIPVVTKYVSDPEMHTITATAIHPGGQYFAGQSSDNQICIYENKGGNFRRIKSKKFASHYCAGYACSIDFSNDGQFLISGDERGKIFFYDWKTSKTYRAIDAHPSVCIGVEWHPSDPNMVASCGWQGLVKLWQ